VHVRFKGYMLDAIEKGDKTVTRRPVRDFRKECPYKVGRTYSATDRPRFYSAGMKSNAKGGWRAIPIKVVSVRKERLCNITEEEAEMEGLRMDHGFTARDFFLNLWGALYGPLVTGQEDPDVWRIEFKRVPESWE